MNSRLDEDTELFIDALRGISAFAVLATHAIDLGIAEVFGLELRSNPEFWRCVRAVIGHGAFAVWAFFMVSGFCIHHSISRSIAAGSFSWRKYALARITRIYSLFLAGLFLAVACWFLTTSSAEGLIHFPWPQFGASLVMLHGFTAAFPAFSPSWSLSNEMLYYALWPVALLVCGCSSNRAARFSMIGSLAVLTAILLLWRCSRRMESSTAMEGIWTMAVLFPIWISGAWLSTNWSWMSSHVSSRSWLQFIPLCVLSMGVLAIGRYQGEVARGINVTGLTAIPGLLVLIAGARHLHLGSNSWLKPVCRWLGQFSYPCYILHYQIIVLLNHYLPNGKTGGLWSNPVWRVSLLMIPTALALALIGPPLERRTMAWRARLLAKA